MPFIWQKGANMAIGWKRKLEALVGKSPKPEYVSWKKLEEVNIFELREKLVPVFPTVYIQIAKDENEYRLRKAAVKKYMNEPFVTYFANGMIRVGNHELISYEPAPWKKKNND